MESQVKSSEVMENQTKDGEEASPSDSHFLLPVNANIACAHEYFEKYSKQIQSCTQVELDGSEVSYIDVTFLQLLVLIANIAKERGLKFAWSAHSDALYQGAVLTGLANILNLNASSQ